MAEPGRPSLYTIPTHRGFADSLVAGLMRRAGSDPLALARGIVLLPNNRGVRALTEAFVRASGQGLLLPRMVALGDPDLGEAIGGALDQADDPDPPPPAVDPYARRLTLTRLVSEERQRAGRPIEASEAVRLAGDLARTLDQLLVEEVPAQAVGDLDLGPELNEHWRRALDIFRIVIDRWPGELVAMGRIDAADRRARLLDRIATRWRDASPAGFVCAAGITDTAPAVARLLSVIARMARGSVVLAGLDTGMPDEEWAALGPFAAETGLRAVEVHPQFALKQMLDRMGFARGEVRVWRGGGDHDAGIARGRAIANALAPAAFTAKWTVLKAEDRRLAGVVAAELATPAEEAQAVALRLREAIEVAGTTAAFVTPDRPLARRVAAHCRRWGIEVDDTAGRALSILPPGTLLLALAECAAQRFAPLGLLALLKHPLVRSGAERLEWLDRVRILDRALRGPRPAAGLVGLDAHFVGRAAEAWADVCGLLAPLEAAFSAGPQPMEALLAALRESADRLCGDELWAGPAGRAAAESMAALEAEAPRGPARVLPDDLSPLLRTLFDEIAVRPPRGGHPRVAIYGLIEARLQRADVMVLGGLNEGVWPGRPAPDPWLAPRVRRALGLPGLERRIGVAAHDFASGLGAPRVLVTRSRRDASAPALASRFWSRLQAMAGDRFERATVLEAYARSIDRPDAFAPATCPSPRPAAPSRPRTISVTEVDRLKADPYAFYAKRILRLSPLDPVDADPSAAWRGNQVHAILEAWWKHDGCAVEALADRARVMLADQRMHPMLVALWQPRLMEAIDWIADRVAAQADEGRSVVRAEGSGAIAYAGVTLKGRYDRIDRLADGTIGIVDYKTGQPPSAASVRAGYSLQLGLLGLIAEQAGFEGIAGQAGAFEYWSLAKRRGTFGYVDTPVDATGRGGRIETAAFVAIAAQNFTEVVGRWLTGDEAFTAKLAPEYAPYAEFDQLMRRDEWYGRDR